MASPPLDMSENITPPNTERIRLGKAKRTGVV